MIIGRVALVMLSVMTWIEAGQTISIPEYWKNTTSSLTRESRAALANDAATALFQQVDLSSGPGKNLPRLQDITSVYAILALQDYHSGNSSWRSVASGLQAYNKQHGLYAGTYNLNGDALYWGITFFYAYRAYQDQVLLDLAIEVFNVTYMAGFITPQAAITGAGAGRNVSFLPSPRCTNDTSAGGVFQAQMPQNSTSINMEALGPFIALAAYLYELTADSFYQQAVQLSLDFTLTHMFNATAGVVGDTLQLNDCSLDMKPLTSNQAWFIEGLSVWANITNNGTLTNFLEAFVANVTTFPTWSQANGVISEAPASSNEDAVIKGIFIRGLTEARTRNPGTSIARYIEAYITLQFNSILNLARSPAPNSSFYSTSWYGPAAQSFNAAGNIAALDVLNAAFSFVTPSSSSSGSSTTASNPPDTSSRSHRTGVIAGSVIGSVALSCICAIFFSWYRRRSRAQNNALIVNGKHTSEEERVPQIIVEPFALRRPSLEGQSKWQRFFEAHPIQGASSFTSNLNHTTTIRARREDGDHIQYASPSQETIAPDRDGQEEREAVPTETSGLAELPALIRRLNILLRGNPEEPPPQYEGN